MIKQIIGELSGHREELENVFNALEESERKRRQNTDEIFELRRYADKLESERLRESLQKAEKTTKEIKDIFQKMKTK